MHRTAKVHATIPGEPSSGRFSGEIRTANGPIASFDAERVPFEIDVDATEFLVTCERTDAGGDVQLEVEVRSDVGTRRLWGRSRGREAKILVAEHGIRCI